MPDVTPEPYSTGLLIGHSLRPVAGQQRKHNMNPLILNRDFQHPTDGWYQIEAPGEHPNRRAGIIQVIDSEAVTSIVNRFNAEADADPNFPGMLIDHEHFKLDDDKETIAYGWLMRLRNRQDIPEGQIR